MKHYSVNELEQNEEQLPWNRRTGAQRRGSRWIERLFAQFVRWNQGEPFRPYYHPGPSAIPPVPEGELLLVFRQFIQRFYTITRCHRSRLQGTHWSLHCS